MILIKNTKKNQSISNNQILSKLGKLNTGTVQFWEKINCAFLSALASKLYTGSVLINKG